MPQGVFERHPLVVLEPGLARLQHQRHQENPCRPDYESYAQRSSDRLWGGQLGKDPPGYGTGLVWQ